MPVMAPMKMTSKIKATSTAARTTASTLFTGFRYQSVQPIFNRLIDARLLGDKLYHEDGLSEKAYRKLSASNNRCHLSDHP